MASIALRVGLVLSLVALAQVARAAAPDGGQLFQAYCSVCHSAEAGETKIGPSLFGVVGRKAGTLAGYDYSDAMKNSGITWTPEALDKYLADPRSIPNIKMIFLGIKNPAERKAVIDYLGTLK